MRATLTVVALSLGLIASIVFFTELQACHDAGGQLVRGFGLTGYVCIK